MSTSIRQATLQSSAALLALVGGSSCLQLRFERDTRLEPVPASAIGSLEPGSADLESVLEALGPPLYAWELPAQGVALAWGWYRSGGWQFKFSIPTPGRAASIYLDYADEAERMRGAVFFFDGDWKLVSVREGMLRDLRNQIRTRPEGSEGSPDSEPAQGD